MCLILLQTQCSGVLDKYNVTAYQDQLIQDKPTSWTSSRWQLAFADPLDWKNHLIIHLLKRFQQIPIWNNAKTYHHQLRISACLNKDHTKIGQKKRQKVTPSQQFSDLYVTNTVFWTQFYIQLVFTAPLCITLKIKIWVVAYFFQKKNISKKCLNFF